MKIAIFGDSYSSTYAYKHMNHYPSWSQLLATKYTVTNFSENGSSLYFMKKIFDKHYKEYDKIIFCITAPGRLEFQVDSLKGNPKFETWYRHISTIRAIRSRSRYPELNEYDKARYQVLYDWMLKIQDFEYEQYVHNMMVKDIINLRPDALLIPCFPISLFDQETALETVTRFEDKFLKKKTGFYNDERSCHMSSNNNKILFELVDNAIVNSFTRVDLNINQFKEPEDGIEKLLEDI